MSQTHTDRVNDEVRRRMTEIASSAGIDRGRISVEVLFLLPPQFVRMYQRVFDAALDDPVRPQQDGGKDEGRIKAKGKPRDDLRARSMGPAKKGKRSVSGYWPVRDEDAMKIKDLLDRRIVRAVSQATEDLRLIRAARVEGGTYTNRPTTGQPQCGVCGKFMKEDWVRCPWHMDDPRTK
jgi:hypothetical protein